MSMQHEDQLKTNITFKMLFVRLWPYARRHLGLFFVVIASIFTLAAISRALPQLIGYAVDEGIQKRQSSVFVQVAWIYLGLEILKSLCNFSSGYLFQIFGNRVLFYIRQDLFKHIQKLPLDYYNKTQIGRIVTRVTNDVVALGELFTEGLISIFIQTVVMISIVIAMLLISPKLTLATMFLAPLFIWAALALSNKIRDILREQKKKLSTLNSFLAENLNGMRVVQLYNRTEKNNQSFEKLSHSYYTINIRSIHAYALMQPIMNIFTACTITAALYYGGVLSLEDALPIGSLVAFLMHAQDFIPPLREIMEKYQQFQNSLTSAERVFSMLDEDIEQDANSQPPRPTEKIGEIKIQNLNFRYSADLAWVLKDINLHIRQGESVAFVGRTGSGKSTLISLLQRFYDAPANTIFVDGMALESIPRQQIRRLIGVCQQDNFIFKGNIIDNVTLHDPEISPERAKEALKQVGYLDLLQRTGRDIYSIVEEKGANLSVGERQLIAFARILAFDPEILILDEATANIDSESELLIQQATQMLMKNRTSLIIAHRLSTIQKCDRIVVLKEGSILEQGSHSELMQKQGYYYQLASAGLKSTDILESGAGTALP